MGVDLGSSSVKVVQATIKGKSIVFTHCGKAAIPEKSMLRGKVLDPEGLSNALKLALKRGNITAKSAAFAITHADILVKTAKYPLGKRKELDGFVENDLPNLLPASFIGKEAVVYSYDVCSKDSQEQEIVFVAARRELVEPHVQVIKAAGLLPLVLDIHAFALSRVNSQAMSRVCYVDLGYAQTEIYVESQGRMRIYRILPTGLQHVESAIMATFMVSQEEAQNMQKTKSLDYLLAEGQGVKSTLRSIFLQFNGGILQTLDYVRMQDRATSFRDVLDHVVLCGGGAHIQGFPEMLRSELDLDVFLLDPFSTVSIADTLSLPSDPVSFGAAAGLAMRGLCE